MRIGLEISVIHRQQKSKRQNLLKKLIRISLICCENLIVLNFKKQKGIDNLSQKNVFFKRFFFKYKNTTDQGSVNFLLSHEDDPRDSVEDEETDLEEGGVDWEVIELIQTGLQAVSQVSTFIQELSAPSNAFSDVLDFEIEINKFFGLNQGKEIFSLAVKERVDSLSDEYF